MAAIVCVPQEDTILALFHRNWYLGPMPYFPSPPYTTVSGFDIQASEVVLSVGLEPGVLTPTPYLSLKTILPQWHREQMWTLTVSFPPVALLMAMV